jgi:hypothetical protein
MEKLHLYYFNRVKSQVKVFLFFISATGNAICLIHFRISIFHKLSLVCGASRRVAGNNLRFAKG